MDEKLAKELIGKLAECSTNLSEVERLAREIDNEDERNEFRKAVIETSTTGLNKLVEYVCYQYPLLSPYKTRKPKAEEMEAAGFDINSPWHANAHEFFGFMCNRCRKKITHDEVPVGNVRDRLLEFCVAVSDEAQKRGWTHVGEYTFLCPGCSNK